MLRKALRKVQIKYFGGIPEGTYERYGIQGTPTSWYTSNAMHSVFILTAFASTYLGYSETCYRETMFENVEINRNQYYGRELQPDFVDMKSVHDGIAGYTDVDPVTGIKKTIVGKHVGPTNKELVERLSDTEVTPEMLSAAKQLRRRQEVYQTEEMQSDGERRVWM